MTHPHEPQRRRTGRLRRWASASGLLLLAVFLTLATAASPKLGKQGGEWFGRLIRAVQRHPAATIAVALGSAGAAWLAIGVGVACQSRQTTHDPSA